MLNVLHISQTDAGGGSARSAYRIHDGLSAMGVESRMLVGEKRTDDERIRRLKRALVWRGVDRACAAVLDRLSLQYVFYPSSFGVALDPWFRDADVVQIYNTHGSYFSHTALPLLSRRKPIVWRLSDMWALTGHVAYSYDCERWRIGCGSCPYLAEYPALRHDRTALLWRIKRGVYRRSRLTLIAPSRWMEQLARESPLLGRFPVRRIQNGVDLNVFRPSDSRDARIRLGLDPERPVVLFSALTLDDRRKGATVLAEALDRLSDVEFELVTAGVGKIAAPRPVVELGRLDDTAMATAYAAADVFVVPTLAENLPNAILESMACGTPCVAFRVGGVVDAVRHRDTGLLATLGDAAELSAGIRELIQDREERARLSRNARAVVEREFSAELELGSYLELYQSLADGTVSRR
jgi:glycosyltransferase involved in cell wall biosynthesis